MIIKEEILPRKEILREEKRFAQYDAFRKFIFTVAVLHILEKTAATYNC